MIFILVSTVVITGVLAGAIELYVTGTVQANVTKDIIENDMYLYRCDIYNDLHISETDYILWKLHQLHLVNFETKQRLMRRFEELDIFKSGSLRVGFEIPREEQVEKLKTYLRNKIREKLRKEKRSPLGLSETSFNEFETVQMLMKLWKVEQELIADRISDTYDIPQVHKHKHLKVRSSQFTYYTASRFF